MTVGRKCCPRDQEDAVTRAEQRYLKYRPELLRVVEYGTLLITAALLAELADCDCEYILRYLS